MSLICSLIDLVLMSKIFFIDLDKTSFLGRSFTASGSSSLIKSKIFSVSFKSGFLEMLTSSISHSIPVKPIKYHVECYKGDKMVAFYTKNHLSEAQMESRSFVGE